MQGGTPWGEIPQQQTVQPQVTVEQVMKEIAAAKTEQELGAIYYKYPQWQRDANFTGALTARKDQLKNNGKS
jgi:arginine repressor